MDNFWYIYFILISFLTRAFERTSEHLPKLFEQNINYISNLLWEDWRNDCSSEGRRTQCGSNGNGKAAMNDILTWQNKYPTVDITIITLTPQSSFNIHRLRLPFPSSACVIHHYTFTNPTSTFSQLPYAHFFIIFIISCNIPLREVGVQTRTLIYYVVSVSTKLNSWWFLAI